MRRKGGHLVTVIQVREIATLFSLTRYATCALVFTNLVKKYTIEEKSKDMLIKAAEELERLKEKLRKTDDVEDKLDTIPTFKQFIKAVREKAKDKDEKRIVKDMYQNMMDEVLYEYFEHLQEQNGMYNVENNIALEKERQRLFS